MRNRFKGEERIESLLEFRWDEILPVFGAINRVHVIVAIGMAHVLQRFAGRIAGLVPRLWRSDRLGNGVSQPCRAGLTFGEPALRASITH